MGEVADELSETPSNPSEKSALSSVLESLPNYEAVKSTSRFSVQLMQQAGQKARSLRNTVLKQPGEDLTESKPEDRKSTILLPSKSSIQPRNSTYAPPEGMDPQDPRYSLAPQDPRYSLAPQDPRYSMAPQDPRYSMAPADPRLSMAPADPRYSMVPADPRFSMAPQDPRLSMAPLNPRYSMAPAHSRFSMAPADPRMSMIPPDPRFSMAKPPADMLMPPKSSMKKPPLAPDVFPPYPPEPWMFPPFPPGPPLAPNITKRAKSKKRRESKRRKSTREKKCCKCCKDQPVVAKEEDWVGKTWSHPSVRRKKWWLHPLWNSEENKVKGPTLEDPFRDFGTPRCYDDIWDKQDMPPQFPANTQRLPTEANQWKQARPQYNPMSLGTPQQLHGYAPPAVQYSGAPFAVQHAASPFAVTQPTSPFAFQHPEAGSAVDPNFPQQQSSPVNMFQNVSTDLQQQVVCTTTQDGSVVTKIDTTLMRSVQVTVSKKKKNHSKGKSVNIAVNVNGARAADSQSHPNSCLLQLQGTERKDNGKGDIPSQRDKCQIGTDDRQDTRTCKQFEDKSVCTTVKSPKDQLCDDSQYFKGADPCACRTMHDDQTQTCRNTAQEPCSRQCEESNTAFTNTCAKLQNVSACISRNEERKTDCLNGRTTIETDRDPCRSEKYFGCNVQTCSDNRKTFCSKPDQTCGNIYDKPGNVCRMCSDYEEKIASRKNPCSFVRERDVDNVCSTCSDKRSKPCSYQHAVCDNCNATEHSSLSVCTETTSCSCESCSEEASTKTEVEDLHGLEYFYGQTHDNFTSVYKERNKTFNYCVESESSEPYIESASDYYANGAPNCHMPPRPSFPTPTLPSSDGYVSSSCNSLSSHPNDHKPGVRSEHESCTSVANEYNQTTLPHDMQWHNIYSAIFGNSVSPNEHTQTRNLDTALSTDHTNDYTPCTGAERQGETNKPGEANDSHGFKCKPEDKHNTKNFGKGQSGKSPPDIHYSESIHSMDCEEDWARCSSNHFSQPRAAYRFSCTSEPSPNDNMAEISTSHGNSQRRCSIHTSPCPAKDDCEDRSQVTDDNGYLHDCPKKRSRNIRKSPESDVQTILSYSSSESACDDGCSLDYSNPCTGKHDNNKCEKCQRPVIRDRYSSECRGRTKRFSDHPASKSESKKRVCPKTECEDMCPNEQDCQAQNQNDDTSLCESSINTDKNCLVTIKKENKTDDDACMSRKQYGIAQKPADKCTVFSSKKCNKPSERKRPCHSKRKCRNITATSKLPTISCTDGIAEIPPNPMLASETSQWHQQEPIHSPLTSSPVDPLKCVTKKCVHCDICGKHMHKYVTSWDGNCCLRPSDASREAKSSHGRSGVTSSTLSQPVSTSSVSTKSSAKKSQSSTCLSRPSKCTTCSCENRGSQESLGTGVSSRNSSKYEPHKSCNTCTCPCKGQYKGCVCDNECFHDPVSMCKSCKLSRDKRPCDQTGQATLNCEHSEPDPSLRRVADNLRQVKGYCGKNKLPIPNHLKQCLLGQSEKFFEIEKEIDHNIIDDVCFGLKKQNALKSLKPAPKMLTGFEDLLSNHSQSIQCSDKNNPCGIQINHPEIISELNVVFRHSNSCRLEDQMPRSTRYDFKAFTDRKQFYRSFDRNRINIPRCKSLENIRSSWRKRQCSLPWRVNRQPCTQIYRTSTRNSVFKSSSIPPKRSLQNTTVPRYYSATKPCDKPKATCPNQTAQSHSFLHKQESSQRFISTNCQKYKFVNKMPNTPCSQRDYDFTRSTSLPLGGTTSKITGPKTMKEIPENFKVSRDSQKLENTTQTEGFETEEAETQQSAS